MVHSICKLIVVLSPLKQCPPDLGTPPALVVTILRFLSSLWSGAVRVLLPDESLGITVHYQALSQYYPARLIPLPYGRKLPYTENVLSLEAGLAYSCQASNLVVSHSCHPGYLWARLENTNERWNNWELFLTVLVRSDRWWHFLYLG